VRDRERERERERERDRERETERERETQRERERERGRGRERQREITSERERERERGTVACTNGVYVCGCIVYKWRRGWEGTVACKGDERERERERAETYSLVGRHGSPKGFVNVKNRHCRGDSQGHACMKQPTFGCKGDPKPSFCLLHRKEGQPFDVCACSHVALRTYVTQEGRSAF
jgi:hypothetical protein